MPSRRWPTVGFCRSILPGPSGRGHVDAVKRWVRVTYESAAYCNAHDRDTVAQMSEITKIPVAVYQRMARIHGSTSSDPSLVQPVIELAVRFKAIPRTFAAKDAYFNG